MQAARNATSTAGFNKAGWEQSEFPIVCETCLGENPFVRMTKNEFNKECKICSRPFTVFRWKPGPNSRFKKTEVCQICAKLKNCCQTCLLDLEFGLPLQLRDQLANAGSDIAEVPKSDMNLEYYAQQAEKKVAAGEFLGGKAQANETLLKIARTTPYYKRNEAHICSFWVKGNCTRGDSCPYRHQKPTDKDDPLAKQNIKDRFYGQNDPVAEKMLKRLAETPQLKSPEDQTITTLYVGGIGPATTERDLRDLFYAYGEIKSIRVSAPQRCAFVTYTTRDEANAAIQRAPGMTLEGKSIKVLWGRPQAPPASAPGFRSGPGQLAIPPPLPSLLGRGEGEGEAPPPPPRPVKFPPPPPKGATAPLATPSYPSMDPSRLGARPVVEAPHRGVQ